MDRMLPNVKHACIASFHSTQSCTMLHATAKAVLQQSLMYFCTRHKIAAAAQLKVSP